MVTAVVFGIFGGCWLAIAASVTIAMRRTTKQPSKHRIEPLMRYSTSCAVLVLGYKALYTTFAILIHQITTGCVRRDILMTVPCVWQPNMTHLSYAAIIFFQDNVQVQQRYSMLLFCQATLHRNDSADTISLSNTIPYTLLTPVSLRCAAHASQA